ncbi:MAG: shikimate dehydrogenase [Candidatus Omnitrophica bacterium]|nr:shikimate dehydrogenase [Candidatus Omnitrophota bacterium]
MIDGKTKVYGIFGFPVEHSLSPSMHNAAFRHLGINAAYLAFSISPDKLKDAVRTIRVLNMRGLNITVPHKENIIRFLDTLSGEARLIGAVNTVVVRKDKLIGYNTDGYGFIRSLIWTGFNPKGKSFLIIGSGGASRSICAALGKLKVKEIFICDVIEEKAKNLKAHIRRIFPNCYIEAVPVNSLKVVRDRLDIVVNATPLGLKETDPLPVDSQILKKGIMVYDLVYNPIETKLLTLAKKKGLRYSNGIGMLLFQGALSFKLWMKQEPPIAVMRRALVSGLSRCKVP